MHRYWNSLCKVLGLVAIAMLVLPATTFAGGKGLPPKLKALIDGGEWTQASPAKNAQGRHELVHKKTGVTFVHIPAGSFTMGRPDGSDEKPNRKVTLKAFLLGKTELTKGAWTKLGGPVYPGGAATKAAKEMPISDVTWTEAATWVKNNGLRLPTEAEWEYACRAGSKTNLISNDQAEIDAMAWHGENSNKNRQLPAKKKPNAWGLYDMCGNTHEWVQDVYEYYSKAPSDGSAYEGDGKGMRVYRGGFYSTYKNKMSCSHRERSNTGSRYESPGVRPAFSLK